MADRGDVVAVGRITRAHGVKGEVAVLLLTQVPSRFEPGSRVVAEDSNQVLTVAATRGHGGRLLVRFEGVVDRNQAEALRGSYLVVPTTEVPELPEGEYWPHELIGCDVITDGDRTLGTIREVLHTEANDVWVARESDEEGAAETLIPALNDVVSSVDLQDRVVRVREVPGLTAP